MKRIISYSFFLLLFFLLGCKKEKDIKYFYYVSATKESDLGMPISEKANINLFNNELDFLANKNPIKTGLIEDGKYYITKNSPQPDNNSYWFRINLGNLNNLRYKTYKISPNYERTTVADNFINYSAKVSSVLSTTPVRVQINVYNNGKPVINAKVKMYLRNDDYVKDIRAKDYTNVAMNYYLSYPWEYDKNNSYVTNQYFDFLNKNTDSAGTVIFENYEPRQYWFRIEKDGMNNAKSIFTTGEPLPDDNNITTVLDVNIQ